MKIEGVCPAIAATFNEDGTLDYDSYVNLIRTLIQGGCHGITLFAIAGEYYKLTDDEMKELVDITVRECKQGGVPSIISVTKHATEVAVKWAQYLENAGADSLMLLPPFFLKPSADGIASHIAEVAKSVSIPIMVQYAPEQTGVSIAPSVLSDLGRQFENISIFKIECKPAGKYISSLIENLGDDDVIFVGNAGYQMIEGFDRGARGVLPGCSMYDLYLKIYYAYLSGDRRKAMELHSILLTMLNHIRQNVEMIIAFEKKILKKRGIIKSDYCRKPSYSIDSYYEKLFEEYYEIVSPYFD